MKNVAVLGAGLVGSLVARDLAADGRWSVLSVDRSEHALGRLSGIPNLATERADLASGAAVLASYRLVKRLDPVHPCFCSHLNHMGDSVIYGPGSDIALMPSPATRRSGSLRPVATTIANTASGRSGSIQL